MTAETSNSRGEWVLVPRVPTEAMKVAALQQAAPLGEIVDWQFDIDDETVDREAVAGIYTAMLAAAPQPPSAPVGVEGFEQWYARVDARFWNNWDACNAAFHAGKRSALAQQPAAVDEALDRMRHAPPHLWRADLVGQQISVERMRDILSFALAAQHQEPTT